MNPNSFRNVLKFRISKFKIRSLLQNSAFFSKLGTFRPKSVIFNQLKFLWKKFIFHNSVNFDQKWREIIFEFDEFFSNLSRKTFRLKLAVFDKIDFLFRISHFLKIRSISIKNRHSEPKIICKLVWTGPANYQTWPRLSRILFKSWIIF